MAKGSVRKKGKKWYYRFYIEDESGRTVCRRSSPEQKASQKRKPLLRKAMEDYEEKKFVAKTENVTVANAFRSYGWKKN